MGLDQYIYKYGAGHKELKEEYETVITDSNNYVNELFNSKPELLVILTDFINDHKEQLSETIEESTKRLTYIVKGILYGNNSVNQVVSALFYDVTIFSRDIQLKENIANDLLARLEACPISEAQTTRLNLEEELESKREDGTEELAYWRKYHDLHNFILNSFGGGNCEDTPLTKENMETIVEFIQGNGHEASKVQNILGSWDDTATYVYHPWW